MEKCSNHKKEVSGISDMKLLATMIGDLHYEILAEFLNRFAEKLFTDYTHDEEAGRTKLAKCLLWTYYGIHKASYGAEQAWKISKPFMREVESLPLQDKGGEDKISKAIEFCEVNIQRNSDKNFDVGEAFSAVKQYLISLK